jgi:heme-degrading monooxygenase HmoA
MIMRVWRGRAVAQRADAYRTHLTSVVWPRLREIEGFVSARLAERERAGAVEFLVITNWSSWEAIRRFAGAEPGRAVVEPEARRVLIDFDEHVEHFEVSSSIE